MQPDLQFLLSYNGEAGQFDQLYDLIRFRASCIGLYKTQRDLWLQLHGDISFTQLVSMQGHDVPLLM
jgi:hypothetical protein